MEYIIKCQEAQRINKGGGEMAENWMPVVGYEGFYEVSDWGRVRSLPRNATTKIRLLKQHMSKRNGYMQVSLCKNNHKSTRRVHVLVMEAFTDFRSHGFDPSQVIDHIDGCKANNHLSNLEVITQAENDRRARVRIKQRYKGRAVIDLDTKRVYKTYTDASRAIGGANGEMVARVCRGERSHYKGRHFAHVDDYFNNTIPAYKGAWKRKASECLWR